MDQRIPQCRSRDRTRLTLRLPLGLPPLRPLRMQNDVKKLTNFAAARFVAGNLCAVTVAEHMVRLLNCSAAAMFGKGTGHGKAVSCKCSRVVAPADGSRQALIEDGHHEQPARRAEVGLREGCGGRPPREFP